MEVEDALVPLLFLLSFRYIGLVFFLPEIIGNPLPPVWATVVGLRDMITGVLSLVAIVALRSRNRVGIGLAWVVVMIGTLDFLYGYTAGMRHASVPAWLGLRSAADSARWVPGGIRERHRAEERERQVLMLRALRS